MNLAHLLLRSARWLPERPALAIGRRAVRSYGEMASRVAQLASGFTRKLSLAKGDRVALAMKNCPEYYELLFACWHAGLAAVPMNARLHPKEFAYILENSGAKACFATTDLESAVPQAHPVREIDRLLADPQPPADVSPDDVAWLFYTSGTTGVPKGAMLTHRNMLFQAQAYFADIDKLAQHDAVLHAAPLSHGSGLYGLPHFAAGAVNVMPESGHFEPSEIFELLEHWPNLSFFAAPTMIVRLLASPAARTPRKLKTITYGGAPMYVADCLRALELFGPRLYQLFGQGEAPMTIAGLRRADHIGADDAVLGSVGYARSGVDVAVLRDDGTPAAIGEIGEIVCRGDVVMSGYWNDPDATAATLQDGWLRTGDMGCYDDRGYLTLRDRSKDVVISGGSNIYPREVEEILLEHPDVDEAGVVGAPDEEWGEVVVAFIVGSASPAELDAHLLERIARFKRPKRYEFIDELPKNSYGKVLKRALRERLI